MKKRPFALFVSGMILLSLCACTAGGNGDTATKEPAEKEAVVKNVVADTFSEEVHAEFDIHNFCSDAEFDSATPMKYCVKSDVNLQTPDTDKMNVAIAAFKASEYYKSVQDEARRIIKYEDGEYVGVEEFGPWTAEAYLSFFNRSATADFEFEPIVKEYMSACFDGKNLEHVFILEIPLPPEIFEWSGDSTCSVPVYVNSENEAIILDSAVQQTLNDTTVIEYEDGICHIIFTSGHSDGTAQGLIYSFSDGAPKLELHTGHIDVEDDINGNCLMYVNYGFGTCYVPFFRDGDRKCYCALGDMPATEELTEYIRNDPAIMEKYADEMMNLYKIDIYTADISVIGGKYINIGSFVVLEVKDGNLVESKRIIPVINDEFEYVLNYDLTQPDKTE